MERRDLDRPATGEAPFVLGETFFSRTDERGIVRAGNDIFRRVSGYEWDELLGAPHKTIRHPDMPKGFFYLFWQTIQAGKPIAGYVKNLAKDGLYYWVLAVVVPIEGGFLSVRIKPSCGHLDAVIKIYSELSRREKEEGLNPEDSAKALIEALVDLGFPNYSEFETRILGDEIQSMDVLLNAQPDISVETFMHIILAVAELKKSTDTLIGFFEEANAIPTNLRLLAYRLEPSGGPLSSLSENYWKMADEMTTWFSEFISSSGNSFTHIQTAINDSMIMRCATRVLNQAAEQFASERRDMGGLDAKNERLIISDLAMVYEQKAFKGLCQTEMAAKEIANTVSLLRRHILGLSTTRIMCKIESAGLATGKQNLLSIISHFEVFQKTVEEILENLENANANILSNVNSLKSTNGSNFSCSTRLLQEMKFSQIPT